MLKTNIAIARFAAKTNIKPMIQLIIKLSYSIIRHIPFKQIDVLVISDFKNDYTDFNNNLKNFKVKHLRFNLRNILKMMLYVNNTQVILVDNINIVISSINNLKPPVIQIWHANSAIKNFGLKSTAMQKAIDKRREEYAHYNYVLANSEYMNAMCKLCFNSEHILNLGSFHSKQLFKQDYLQASENYIVYVPTFRWNDQDNKLAIDFINTFESQNYTLLYCTHPKITAKIENPQVMKIESSQIRKYFAYASLVISDYSSLLVDASLVCNSVCMYAYDYDTYKLEPGLAIDQDEFWGYFTTDQKQLLMYIEDGTFKTHDCNFIKQKYFTYDDMDSQKRVANFIEKNLLKKMFS